MRDVIEVCWLGEAAARTHHPSLFPPTSISAIDTGRAKREPWYFFFFIFCEPAHDRVFLSGLCTLSLII